MGSNPITHPIFLLGCSQVVRHETLTLAFRRSESCHPSQFFAGVAELVDAVDLGSTVRVGVRVSSSAPSLNIICGSDSVVECHLAKVEIASSNLVFRSNMHL